MHPEVLGELFGCYRRHRGEQRHCSAGACLTEVGLDGFRASGSRRSRRHFSRAYAPRRCAGNRRAVSPLGVIPDSFDEIGLVDHAIGLTAADADEDTLVQPVECRSRGFDLG
jgi:hypothetical protein